MKSGRRDARGRAKTERAYHRRWEELQRRKVEKQKLESKDDQLAVARRD
jgi:hypothetical protein